MAVLDSDTGLRVCGRGGGVVEVLGDPVSGRHRLRVAAAEEPVGLESPTYVCPPCVCCGSRDRGAAHLRGVSVLDLACANVWLPSERIAGDACRREQASRCPPL